MSKPNTPAANMSCIVHNSFNILPKSLFRTILNKDIFEKNYPMGFINIEIKAYCTNPAMVEETLKQKKADYKGVDHQMDTYFNVPFGRLKLREGNIENSLIYYQRENSAGPKTSNVLLYEFNMDKNLKDILVKSLGVLAVVNKKRKIYFIENVKFHIDKVDRLGSFVEIEAIDKKGSIGKEMLKQQCESWIKSLAVEEKDLVEDSYSDLVLKKSEK
ncbi:MAG: class IV adenylate cyclase [Bacteroidales bacterium]